MEFREYLGVLRKYWVSIVVLTLLGVIGAGVYVVVTPPVYSSTSMVFLSVSIGNTAADYVQGTNYATAQARSFAQIVTTQQVLDPVVKDLQLNTTSTSLASRVSANVVTNTSLITITAKDGDPARSADITQHVAQSLVQQIEKLSPTGSDYQAVVVGTIVQPAATPSSPTSPQPVQSAVLGLVAGLAVGVILSIIRKAMDVRLHVAKDVTEATGCPVIGSIPKDPLVARGGVVMLTAPTSPISERYRQIRTNLLFMNIDADKPWNFVVTSSIESEGKSSTAINIAYALSESGNKVLLIDGDLRRPKIASYLKLEGAAGLTTVLTNRASFSDVVQSLGEASPDVLTSGVVPPNPAELLGSRRMKQLLEQVSRQYQAVVIDTAPLLPVADTLPLLPQVSGAVVVAAAERVTIPELKTALDTVDRTGVPVMGIVLNKVSRRSHQTGYHNYTYAYASKEAPSAEPKERRQPKRAQAPV
ncbi:MAG: polysaccharide biosynthesis tyrosine autokinase [Propionibacteriaceae bacterium]|nr:polysaccharide biosynthesis tyrosine autokinase [Propionibacteriaceae bacterium]